jgi:hypothetical protein
MVRHATQKKRRRGTSTKLKPQKHRSVRIANSVTHASVKEIYDKKLSPTENLQKFGLEADANKFKRKDVRGEGGVKKCAAFVGYAELPQPKKEWLLSEQDADYAKLCIKRYGANYKKMAKDIEVNFNQLTEHKLEKLCTKYLEEQEKRK